MEAWEPATWHSATDLASGAGGVGALAVASFFGKQMATVSLALEKIAWTHPLLNSRSTEAGITLPEVSLASSRQLVWTPGGVVISQAAWLGS